MIKFLKKILKNKKLIVFSILGILGFSILLPQLAHADAFGVMDIFSMQLDALDFLDNSIRKYLVLITIIIAESMAYLWTSSAILDWVMQLEVNIIHNPLVVAGWGFISGVANLIIIISFVWTGLSMIMQGDSKKGQSTLLRLIVIAIFVNFSLLAVGALVDVAGFLQWGIMNTFSTGEEGASLAQTAQKTLSDYSVASLAHMVTITVAETLASLVPVGNVASIVVTTIGFLTLSVTGWLPIMIFNIILNFIIGSTFFLLAAILLMRVCFLWILAITAPLAVVLYKSEIPFFNKFYNEWWRYFMDWLFAGVIIIFFLGLGFKLFGIAGGSNTIVDWGNPFAEVPYFGHLMPKFFINYVFLFLYMVVICVIMSKNWIPGMGQQIIDQATGFATKVNKKFSPKIKEDLVAWEARSERKAQDREEMSPEEFKNKYSDRGEYKDTGFNKALETPFAAYRRYVKRERPGGAQREVAEMLNKDFGKFANMSADELQKMISTKIGPLEIGKGTLNTKEIASALMAMKPSEINKFIEQNEENKALMGQIYNAVTIGNANLQERVQRASILGNEGDNGRLQRLGSSVEEAISNAMNEKSLEISNKAIENSAEVRDAISKHWTGKEHEAKIGQSKDYIRIVNANYSQIKPEESKNPEGYKYFEAQSSIFKQEPNYKAAGDFFNRVEKEEMSNNKRASTGETPDRGAIDESSTSRGTSEGETPDRSQQ